METKKYQLPKNFAIQWVNALRSGEYQQTQEILAKMNDGVCSYCCLGVAGKIRHLDSRDLCKYGELAELSQNEDDYDDLTEIYGIPKALISGDLKTVLIDLNDNKGLSFEAIADFIEQNVEFI